MVNFKKKANKFFYFIGTLSEDNLVINIFFCLLFELATLVVLDSSCTS